MSNALVEMLLVFDSEPRLSDEQMTQAFWTYRDSKEDLVREFYFTNEFDDRLCCEDVR